MTKKQFKTILIFLSFFILSLFSTNKVFASTLSLNPSKDSVGIGEQFYVDLLLDTEGESVNTISGSVSFPNKDVYFLRAEDGKSMVNLWVEKPKLDKDNINFAGVMSNGFSGVIDPFNLNHKLPGLIIRLVFEAKNPGKVEFSTLPFSLNLNDGLGTEIKAPATNSYITIGDFINKFKYENKEAGTPELEAFITHDLNIFNDKYILIFKATDKETGIRSVKIKEGRRDWKEIESPYLLIDQSRHSDITLQAVNFSGAGIIINIDKIPYDWELIIKVLIIIISITILSILIIIKKRNVQKK